MLRVGISIIGLHYFGRIANMKLNSLSPVQVQDMCFKLYIMLLYTYVQFIGMPQHSIAWGGKKRHRFSPVQLSFHFVHVEVPFSRKEKDGRGRICHLGPAVVFYGGGGELWPHFPFRNETIFQVSKETNKTARYSWKPSLGDTTRKLSYASSLL